MFSFLVSSRWPYFKEDNNILILFLKMISDYENRSVRKFLAISV